MHEPSHYEQHGQKEGDLHISPSALVNALEAFASATTFEMTHRVLLEQQALLLSPLALTTVQLMIDDLYANNRVAEAENWRQYLRVLEHARINGIDSAWKYFMALQQNAMQAIEVLTTTPSITELFQAVKDYQHILLSDAAIVMLRETIQQQQSHAPLEALDYWHSLLHLLEDIREHGLTAAWQAFEIRQQS